MKYLYKYVLALVVAVAAVSCADDDSFTTSVTNYLVFSTDSVKMDTVFSRVPTSTKTFWVYNKSGDGIRCTNIRLAHGNQTGFRVNVDGVYLGSQSGYQTSNVEIRDKDSIRVFVELTSPLNGKDTPQLLEDDIVFRLESGKEQKVNLSAYSWDATMINNLEVSRDTTINSYGRPLIIHGGILVDSLATLRIAAGTTLYFHNGAGIEVFGNLLCEGTAEKNVVLRGDRTDRMFDYLPYDRVSGQWEGIYFHESSYDNVIDYTDIHSTFNGIVCDSSDVSKQKLLLKNSIVHNCQGYGIKAVNSWVDIQNSQITNTFKDCVAVFGGQSQLLHCTLAQFYPFDSRRGAALRFYNSENWPLLGLDCINSIVTGYSNDVIMGEQAVQNDDGGLKYRFISSIVRTDSISADSEEAPKWIDVIWDNSKDDDAIVGEKHFRMVDGNKQAYDFRLDSLSTAIGKANPEYVIPLDRDGVLRDGTPDIGAYEFVKKEEEQQNEGTDN